MKKTIIANLLFITTCLYSMEQNLPNNLDYKTIFKVNNFGALYELRIKALQYKNRLNFFREQEAIKQQIKMENSKKQILKQDTNQIVQTNKNKKYNFNSLLQYSSEEYRKL